MSTHTNTSPRPQWRHVLARTAVAGAAAAVLALPAVLAAQSAPGAQTDSRWQAWRGCWQPATAANTPSTAGTANSSSASAPVVCVVPAGAPSAVDVVTIASGKVAARERIDATGAQVPRSANGCTGWQSATWSADGRRVYLRSQDTCAGGVARSSTGLMAMSPAGEWLDVQGATMGGNTGVSVVRYQPTGVPSSLPADIAQNVAQPAAAPSEARAVAGAAVTTAEVIDASRRVDSAVVAAWVLARGQRFALDADKLVALANAGVAGEVTDAMVAVSYPKSFALAGPNGETDLQPAGTSGAAGMNAYGTSGRMIPVMMDPYYGSYSGYMPYGGFYSRYGYSPYGYSPYGYSAFGYSPYGYAPFGYGASGYAPYYGYSSYGYYGGAPIIVLRGSNSATQGGRVIKGYGYTQGNGTRTARPSGSVTPSGWGRSVQSGGSRGTSSAPTRTAHPRP